MTPGYFAAINRTIFGIETNKCFSERMVDTLPINRTIFGIETMILFLIHGQQSRLSIAPSLELKRV